MARKRMISPEIWESDSFSNLTDFAKLIFIGLISQADDEGFGKAKPAAIRSKLFPNDEDRRIADIDKALLEIGRKMSVTLYEIGGIKYYRMDNWTKWQSIEKPRKSEIPKPPNTLGVGGELPNRGTIGEASGNSRGIVGDLKRKGKGIEKEKEMEDITPVGASTCDSSVDKKPTFHKHGTYGRIMLTSEQYDKLIAEFGQTLIDKQINSLDEYVQSNNNKNGYKDFNLVLRKSLRENWFENKNGQSLQGNKPKNNVGLDL